MMKKIVRRLALSVPPMKRFYDFAMYHSHMNVEHQAHIIEINDRMLEMNDRVADMRGEVVEAETREAEARERAEKALADAESLDVQVYVLRSDLQRAAARNERLSHELHRAEQASADAAAERLPLETVTRVIDELRMDVRLGEARVGARVASLLGGVKENGHARGLAADGLLNALEFFVANQVPRGAGGYLSVADQHVRVRMLRSLAARARLSGLGDDFLSLVDGPLDAVLIHAAIVAGGHGLVDHVMAPAAGTRDIAGWRSMIGAGLEHLDVDGIRLAAPDDLPVGSSAMVCVAIDQIAEAGDLVKLAHEKAAVGGLVVVLTQRSQGILDRMSEWLPQVSPGEIDDAGCVLYWRKNP